MKRKLIVLGALLVVGLALGELGARYLLGLGTPPLSVAHPRIEYMFAPNQDVRRFGNRQLFNEYGMRNPKVSEWGAARRVLVFGDSVLNGGSLTDHEALATTLATRETPGSVFGNVSAGSWGIDNMLGWIETYGLLEADTVIFVLNSGDAEDAPTFAALNPLTHPTSRPMSALSEGVRRYLLKSVTDWLEKQTVNLHEPIKTTQDGHDGTQVLPIALNILREAGVQVCGVLHASRAEQLTSDHTNLNELVKIFEEHAVPVVRMYELRSQSTVSDATIYRDAIHLNLAGQKILTKALLSCDVKAREPQKVLRDD